MSSLRPLVFLCKPTELFPNSHLPIVLYKGAFNVFPLFKRRRTKKILAQNDWTKAVTGRIPIHPQYHSNTHVVIAVLRGTALLQIGGNTGQRIRIDRKDALIIPAGVAYKNLDPRAKINCMFAWSCGTKGDVNMGLPQERPAADSRILKIPHPALDPVHGASGFLVSLWQTASLAQNKSQVSPAGAAGRL